MNAESVKLKRFLLTIIACFSIVLVMNFLIAAHSFAFINPKSMVFNRFYLLLIAAPVLILLIANKDPLSMAGFTAKQWKMAIAESFLLSALIVFAMLYIKHNFHLGLFTTRNAFALTYFTSVIVQESLRCYFQNSLQDIFNDKWHRVSIFLSAFIFGMMHIHYGLAAVALLFSVGVVLALLYIRHQTIYGLLILHNAVGITAFVAGYL